MECGVYTVYYNRGLRRIYFLMVMVEEAFSGGRCHAALHGCTSGTGITVVLQVVVWNTRKCGAIVWGTVVARWGRPRWLDTWEQGGSHELRHAGYPAAPHWYY